MLDGNVFLNPLLVTSFLKIPLQAVVYSLQQDKELLQS